MTRKTLGIVAALVAMFVLCCGGVTTILSGAGIVTYVVTTDEEIVKPPPPGDPRCREDVPHCMKVRTARSKIAPFDADILEYATKAYNKNVGGNLAWAKRCVSHRADFEQIERKTLYPIEMIMGIASHESIGCKAVKATNGDGGTGYMQVTNAPPEFKQRAASMVGLKSVSELDLDYAPHNVAVGMVIWDDCEVITGRRDIAALCYNRGIGATNAVAKWARPKGTTSYPGFTLMYPYINGKVYHTLGPISRKYTGEVLAHMVMVNMLMKGQEPKMLPKGALLRLEDIPGWDPSHDGDRFVVGLVGALPTVTPAAPVVEAPTGDGGIE